MLCRAKPPSNVRRLQRSWAKLAAVAAKGFAKGSVDVVILLGLLVLGHSPAASARAMQHCAH